MRIYIWEEWDAGVRGGNMGLILDVVGRKGLR